MNILLIGYRENVLIIKYKILLKNWNINFKQCYSFEAAEEFLQQASFDCIIHSLFDWNAKLQYQKLAELNRRFQVPIKVWRD